MAQSSTSSILSSAPSTSSDSGSPSPFQTTYASRPGLPKRANESPTLPFAPLKFPRRSVTDPLPSNGPRSFSDPHKSSSDAAAVLRNKNRHSQHSAIPSLTGGEKERGTITTRHSHLGHANVHTECGRHSDNWLFGGFSLVDSVKRIFEKK